MPGPDVRRLASHRTIDLTTFGRRSGRPARIETWWFHFDDRFIITGRPGRRDWSANVTGRAEVVVHGDGQPGRLRWLTEEIGFAGLIGTVVDELARLRGVSAGSLVELVRSNMATPDTKRPPHGALVGLWRMKGDERRGIFVPPPSQLRYESRRGPSGVPKCDRPR